MEPTISNLLDILPNEIINVILAKTDLPTLGRFSQVSKKSKTIIDYSLIWQSVSQSMSSKFGQLGLNKLGQLGLNKFGQLELNKFGQLEINKLNNFIREKKIDLLHDIKRFET